jgi:hypothetical protein
MFRIPFPSTGTENITLFRGGKRARRDALKDGMSHGHTFLAALTTVRPSVEFCPRRHHS